MTDEQPQAPNDHFEVRASSINLPKGGGALKNIDEKFQVNSANGTASFSMPLPISKTRNDFSPALSLSYNSGSGNGVFGLGWSCEGAYIQRRTDKQLPSYRDALESDVFLFNGAEDLVPVSEYPGNNGETIRRYRPRIESAFSRIERVTPAGSRIFYWKVTSKNNVATIFGRSDKTQIADSGTQERIFKWLPELSYDDQGNTIEYEYISEDFRGVKTSTHEVNRLNGYSLLSNKYLKRVHYGNTTPYFPDPAAAYNPPAPVNPGYLFEIVFDFGDHDTDMPTPIPQKDWDCRIDPFSNYKAAFEIRNYRLCQRILFFHYFKELNDGKDNTACLVRSLDLSYRILNNPDVTKKQVRNAETDYIISLQQSGYIRKGAVYSKKSLPPVLFSYQERGWDTTIREVSAENTANDPVGLSSGYQWTDLWGEGISGILTEQAGGWFYKSNLGDGNFSPSVPVISKPSLVGLAGGTLQLQDLEGDGRKFIVSGQPAGYFALDEQSSWEPFRPFPKTAHINPSDPNTKFIDVNGDGRADLVVTMENVFTWFASDGIGGYDSAILSPKPYDEERGPALVFADVAESIFLADMSGDGLTDIVRIRNGEACYWPNEGYGKFGAKVNMDFAPIFDQIDQFNPRYLHLFDITGTGTTDLIYAGRSQCLAWLNLSGNAWSEAQTIDTLPPTESPNQVTVADFLGNGTGSVVWSSPLPAYTFSPMRYIDLMGGIKPYIMNGYQNNFGKKTSWNYQSSSLYYLQDKQAGSPWVTKLCFPVQCVASTTTIDLVSGIVLTNSFSYHHGYYDHIEKEFRGFGRVEEMNTEAFADVEQAGAGLFQPPVKTVTWYHTGAYFNELNILAQFAHEYNRGALEFELPSPVMPAGLVTPDDWREAARACKGMLLRQEVYSPDGGPMEKYPYSVVTQNTIIQQLQARGNNRYSVFLAQESESVSFYYERNMDQPRIQHNLNLEVDAFGNVLKAAIAAYGRRTPDAALPNMIQELQGNAHVTYTKNDYTTNYFDLPEAYRLKQIAETTTFELTNANYDTLNQFSIQGLLDDFGNAALINYETSSDGSLQKRLIEDVRTIYLDEDLISPLAFLQLKPMGLVYQSYKMAFTPSLVTSLFGDRLTNPFLQDAKYIQLDGINWWASSGRQLYLDVGEPVINAQNRFFLAVVTADSYGNETQYFHDVYSLLLVKTLDPLLNNFTVQILDYRLLLPVTTIDLNGNTSEILLDELGMVIATSVYGTETDGLHGDQSLSSYVIKTANDLSDVIATPLAYLQEATTFFYYDVFSWVNKGQPVNFVSITRETHSSELAAGTSTRVFINVGYSGGFGQVLVSKSQAEPGKALKLEGGNVVTVDTSPLPRWISTGRTVFNNKGNPIRKFEPFFSDSFAYEPDMALQGIGFSVVLYYDPLGRIVKTVFPDGTHAAVEFDAWHQFDYDQNDTVTHSTWYDVRILHPVAGIATPEQIDAAKKAAAHDNTPAQSHFDSLGRAIYRIADNGGGGKYGTQVILDIENNQKQLIDPRGNIVMKSDYDMISRTAHQTSIDGGERFFFLDTMNNQIYKWDSRDQRFRTEYDKLHRPTYQWLMEDVHTNIPEKLVALSIYGENQSLNGNTDMTLNFRGRLFQSYDQAGLTQVNAYDFKSNVKQSFKQLAADYKNIVDWNVPDKSTPLDTTRTFSSSGKFDATSKAVELDLPDGSKILPFYNATNLLTKIDVNVQNQQTDALFVQNIDYNAKGQRKSILYGNNTSTTYTYEDTTYRLLRLLTTRNTGSDALQDLNYVYDPVGNVTQVEDRALQTIFFNNGVADPSGDYTYDPIYRLIIAESREHVGQNSPSDQFDLDKTAAAGQRLVLPGDGNAMQRYQEQYLYDNADNMIQMIHNAGNGPFINKWTRFFTYKPANNQLNTTQIGANSITYQYDAHGNMLNLQQVGFAMNWNFADQLQEVGLGGGGTAYYVYDGSGQRVRKVIENAGLVKETVYLSLYEMYTETQHGNIQVVRETIHIMDDKNRVALIESRVQGKDNGQPFLIRYQYANQLESACLELTGSMNATNKNYSASLISYEEYYPFGSTAYQATDNQTETAKRYRYNGRERDEESGLNYHGARYYAPWLARWTAVDPTGIKDGANDYEFCHSNPINHLDQNGKNARSQDSLDKVARGNYRKSTGVTDSAVQVGHTRAYRHSGESGISPQDLHDPTKFQLLHSRKGRGLDVEVTDPVTGEVKVRSRHTSQEGFINDAVGRARQGAKLTAQGQKDAGDEVLFRTENVPVDQRNIEMIRQSGVFDEAAAIERSPAVQEYRKSKLAQAAAEASPPTSGETKIAEPAHAPAPTEPNSSALGKGKAVAGKVVGGLLLIAAAKQFVKEVRAGDYKGATKTAALTVASETVLAPVVAAYGVASVYQDSPEIDQFANDAGRLVEKATGSRTLGALTAAGNAVAASVGKTAVGIAQSAIEVVTDLF